MINAKPAVIFDVTCDICKNSCKTHYGDFEYSTLEARWGYASNKDGKRYEMHFCEQCFDKLMEFIVSIGGEPRYEHYFPF